jgi:hypothetical protein
MRGNDVVFGIDEKVNCGGSEGRLGGECENLVVIWGGDKKVFGVERNQFLSTYAGIIRAIYRL